METKPFRKGSFVTCVLNKEVPIDGPKLRHRKRNQKLSSLLLPKQIINKDKADHSRRFKTLTLLAETHATGI
jgi:hypothetical protein